jgi:hypothetical protein
MSVFIVCMGKWVNDTSWAGPWRALWFTLPSFALGCIQLGWHLEFNSTDLMVFQPNNGICEAIEKDDNFRNLFLNINSCSRNHLFLKNLCVKSVKGGEGGQSGCK